MTKRIVLVSLAAACLSAATPAFAQNESALRAYFEGKQVILRVDMPGTSDGVDVRVDRGGVMDAGDYGTRIKRYGVSLQAGERVVITLVKMKSDHIEFQLGGGGFGTFGDDTSTAVYVPYVEKSRREIELEKRVREEDDRRVRRDLQRQLDDLRTERERANRRIDEERAHLEQMKRDRVAAERQRGGSRFNLQYGGNVPRDVRPDDVINALAEYVDFSPLRGGPSSSISAALDMSVLRKGMSREDVERAFGRPMSATDRRDNGLVTTTLVFGNGDQRITADFVEDVLVRYTVSSR